MLAAAVAGASDTALAQTTAAPASSLPAVLPAEPSSPTVGHVRRNAQGVIELVRPSAPAQQAPAALPSSAVAPAAAPAAEPPKPRAQPPVRATQTAAPAAPATTIPVERRCSDGVLLCLAVLGGEGGGQDNVPLTFGHPLAPKLLQPGQRLVGKFKGASLPVQIDQVATHYDGSVRFAVFSLVLPRVSDRGPHVLELAPDTAASLPAPPPIAPLATDFRIEIETYAAQVFEVVLGNRQGHTPGIPFNAGETITLVLGEGAGEERFGVTVVPEMATGDHSSYTKIAQAFVAAAARSQRYHVHRDGIEVYEKFWATSRDPEGRSFPIRFAYAGSAKIAVREVQAWAPRKAYVAPAPAQAAGAGEKWLDGALAREAATVVPFRSASDNALHPYLTATIGARQYANVGGVRIEATIENTKAFVEGVRDIFYDVALRDGRRTYFQMKGLTHNAFTRWHRYEWVGEAPRATVLQDRTRLLASLAVPNYDPNLRFTEGDIQGSTQFLSTRQAQPMGTGSIYTAMTDTGGRADIGPLPTWSVRHLLTQDPRLREAVLVNGDLSGTAPMHYREPASGKIVHVTDHRNVRWLWDRQIVDGKTIMNGFSLPRFKLDVAHQPSLAYYPYLLTGDRYYLEETMFWTGWNALYKDGGPAREFRFLDDEQARGKAWGLRTLGHAALIAPDRHPMKRQLMAQLHGVVEQMNNQHHTGAPPKPGVLPGVINNPYGHRVGPWQQDYAMMVIALLAENKVPGADQLMRWAALFSVGRFFAEDAGFCRNLAISYWSALPEGKPEVNPWAEFRRLNWPDVRNCKEVPWNDRAGDAGGYTALARAALASMVNAGFARAREPYDLIRTQTDNRQADYGRSPNFAIVPRSP